MKAKNSFLSLDIGPLESHRCPNGLANFCGWVSFSVTNTVKTCRYPMGEALGEGQVKSNEFRLCKCRSPRRKNASVCKRLLNACTATKLSVAKRVFDRRCFEVTINTVVKHHFAFDLYIRKDSCCYCPSLRPSFSEVCHPISLTFFEDLNVK